MTDFQQAKKPTNGTLSFYKLWQSPSGLLAGNPRQSRTEADPRGLQGLAADGVLHQAGAAESDRPLASMTGRWSCSRS